MSGSAATFVLVARKLRAGWLVSTEVSGPGQRITVSDPARRGVVMELIQFHFLNRHHLYPSAADAMNAARAIATRWGGSGGMPLNAHSVLEPERTE